MKLYYCDTCGLRIPANEIPPDDQEPEDGKYFCAQHRPAPVIAQPAKPPSASMLQVPIPHSGQQPRTKIPSGTRASIPRMTPAHQNPPQPPGKPAAGNKNLLIFGSAGGVFVVLVLVIALSGHSKPTPEKETPVAESHPAAPMPAKTPTPVASHTPASQDATALPTGPGFLTPYSPTTPDRDRAVAETPATPVKPVNVGTTLATPDSVIANVPPDKSQPIEQIAAPVAADPRNLITDPGFESGTATAWQPYNDASVVTDPSKAHTGKCYARVGVNNAPTLRQVVTGLTPLGKYTATAWIKGATVGLGVKEYGGVEIERFNKQDGYQLVTISFTLGSTAKSAKIFFRQEGRTEALIDDVTLVADTGAPEANAAGAKTPIAAAPETPAVPAEAATKPTEESPAQKFEGVREKAYALLQQGKTEAGIAVFTDASADAQLAAQASEIETATAVAKGYEAVLNAAPDGLKKLSDGRAFTFKKKEKGTRDIPVGGGTKASVAEFKDGDIVIETKDGGMIATQKIIFEELSEQTRLDLAALALPPGPESDLKLAFAEFLLLRAGRIATAPGLHAHLERVKKSSATAPGGEFLQRELDNLAVNQRIDAAGAKIDAAIQAGNTMQARSIYSALKKEFAESPPLHVKKFFEEHRDMEVQPGLWASYYSGATGKEFSRYHLSRAETSVNLNWGQKSPDPSIPNDDFSGIYCGFLRVEKAGDYTFTSKSDDAIVFTLDGKRVIENYINALVTAKVTLTAGDHPIRIYYHEDGGGAWLLLRWKLEGGFDTQDIPASALWHNPMQREEYQKPGK